ncbi:MAG TPA: alpha/beta family hydrolase [Actinomycetota bacterium]|nr:alpha/beta family hydrolase [Actinomycetota bacterium]
MKLDTAAGAVSAARDGPDDARIAVVLGHGAGAGMDNDFMVAVARGLAERGAAAWRFNFAYVERGRRAPDRQDVLERTYADVAEHVRAHEGAARLVLGGKSLGGRIASHVVASGTRADGLLFLGYPLHPPGRPDRIRDAHLRGIEVPMLFVEGTRDPFCPLDTLERVRATLTAPTDVVVIEDGDHSFKVRKSSGRGTPEAWAEVVTAAATWLAAR